MPSAMANSGGSHTNASSSGGSSAPRVEAASEWSPATTGPASSPCIRSARDTASAAGSAPLPAPAEEPVQVYAVRVEGGEVYVGGPQGHGEHPPTA